MAARRKPGCGRSAYDAIGQQQVGHEPAAGFYQVPGSGAETHIDAPPLDVRQFEQLRRQRLEIDPALAERAVRAGLVSVQRARRNRSGECGRSGPSTWRETPQLRPPAIPWVPILSRSTTPHMNACEVSNRILKFGWPTCWCISRTSEGLLNTKPGSNSQTTITPRAKSDFGRLPHVAASRSKAGRYSFSSSDPGAPTVSTRIVGLPRSALIWTLRRNSSRYRAWLPSLTGLTLVKSAEYPDTPNP